MSVKRGFVGDHALFFFFLFSVKTQKDKHVSMYIMFLNTLTYVCVMYICVFVWGQGCYHCVSKLGL